MERIMMSQIPKRCPCYKNGKCLAMPSVIQPKEKQKTHYCRTIGHVNCIVPYKFRDKFRNESLNDAWSVS